MTINKKSPDFAFIAQYDFSLIRRFVELCAPFLKYYFRSEAQGLSLFPKQQTLLIANHDGGMLPIDALLLLSVWHQRFQFRRPLFILVHDIVFKLFGPWKYLLYQAGCIPAHRANLEELLQTGRDVLIYPGGDRETFRPFSKRKEITLGGRMGFIRYALKYRLPVTPVVSTGAHETFFVLSRGEWIARKLKFSKYFRAEVFPLIAGLPFGIWIGTGIPQFPLPAKLTLQVLPPLSFPLKKLKDRTDPSLEKILRDENLLKHYFSQVRTRMQQGLDQLYAKRRFPILG